MNKPLFRLSLTVILTLCLFTIHVSGQAPIKNYEKEWKKAEDFSKRGLPKSALEEVKKIYALAKKEKQDIEAHGKKISAVSLTVAAQVGKDDKMFGSVTAKDIAEGLAEQGFTVDRRKIQLAQPIKELGTFAIAIKLPREVTATIAVHVVKKQDEQEAQAEPEEAAPTA